MTYTIRITNKYVDPSVTGLNEFYLNGISPQLVSSFNTTYEDFISDMEITDTSLYVPLYERNQVVKLPASSVLIITTENANEAVYYNTLTLNNSMILINPAPIEGSSNWPVLIEKEITENGVYNASSDDADGYSSVNVTVENSYTADDNGKVVSNQELVTQTAYPTEITENNIYDTTNYNSITVNVSGGGSSSNIVARCKFEYSYTQFCIENEDMVIEEYVFNDCTYLTDVTISSGVTSIGNSAFCYCFDLTEITIPRSVTIIDDLAFYSCTSLETVNFESPSSLETIDNHAFDYCSALTSITIPSGVTSIGIYAFADCPSLTSITFEPTAPPDLAGKLGIETTCTIRVPQGTLSAYTSADNYPDPSEYTYEEY